MYLPRVKWGTIAKGKWLCVRAKYRISVTTTPKGLFHWQVIGEKYADFGICQTKELAMARAEIVFIRLFLKDCIIRPAPLPVT